MLKWSLDQNKSKMSRFSKLEFQIALNLNFNCVQNFVILKSGKSHIKIVKFDIKMLSICIVKFNAEKSEHLYSNTKDN